MKETLEVIVKNLVDSPEEVSINELDGEKSIVFEVKVAETDMGKVIGKQGRVAKSVRTVMKAVAAKIKKELP